MAVYVFLLCTSYSPSRLTWLRLAVLYQLQSITSDMAVSEPAISSAYRTHLVTCHALAQCLLAAWVGRSIGADCIHCGITTVHWRARLNFWPAPRDVDDLLMSVYQRVACWFDWLRFPLGVHSVITVVLCCLLTYRGKQWYESECEHPSVCRIPYITTGERKIRCFYLQSHRGMNASVELKAELHGVDLNELRVWQWHFVLLLTICVYLRIML